ncbi:MAG TPA: HAMP domain-containing sensor histidine kinase, partial [Steroidobacteraceae bacterium]
VLYVNQAWDRFATACGVPAAHSTAGSNYFMALAESCLGETGSRAVVDGIRAVMAGRAGQFSFEYSVDEGEQRHWFQMTVTPCVVRGSTHAVVVHAPIDECKRVEEDLRSLHRKKDEFFATLLHELRNPLAPIANAVELLGATDDARTLSAARAIIQRQLHQLKRLVDDLLDVSRIARGNIEIQRDVLDIGRVIASALETARPLIKMRQHHLSMTVPVTEVLVEGDAMRLEQVFTNLLINAAKYTEPGGQISVTLECQDGEAIVRVRDNGIGISRELLPRIFDLFAQGAPQSIRSRGGLGVGLTLVRQLIELHHGSVSAYSEGPGCGSEFTVRLPLSASLRPRRCRGESHSSTAADDDTADPDSELPEQTVGVPPMAVAGPCVCQTKGLFHDLKGS